MCYDSEALACMIIYMFMFKNMTSRIMQILRYSSSRSVLTLVLIALQHVVSHRRSLIFLYIYQQYIYLPFSVVDWLVNLDDHTSASVFLLSHRILLCARVVALSEKASTIQYGYRKWVTHARVFSQTLAHGNSKNEIRQRKRGR